jgi:uncharacterized membrane protein YciS (DUF1049 family)
MLEWRPRLIVLVLVLALVVFALATGYASDDLIRNNWEW